MTRLKNTTLNCSGLCRYLEPIKPKKIVGQSIFKNYLNCKISIKCFTTTWPNGGTNNNKFLENIFTQKLLQEENCGTGYF